MLISCKSALSDRSSKIFLNIQVFDHFTNRLYTVCQGPYRSGRSRHDAPLLRIQNIPLSICRESLGGRPRRTGSVSSGIYGFICFHSSSVTSYHRIVDIIRVTSGIIIRHLSTFFLLVFKMFLHELYFGNTP